MIVPREKLVWSAALVAVPLLALMGMVSPLAWLFGSLLAASVLVVALDARISRDLLSGLKISIGDRISLFKGREGALEVRFHQEHPHQRRLRLGLNLPPAFQSKEESILLDLPSNAAESTCFWNCTPSERGGFALPSVHVEMRSRWGFWWMRMMHPLKTEIRVYPDLFAERKHVAMLFLKQNFAGIHSVRQLGKGRDFEKLRDYVHGDPLGDIHWKATAKRGRPVSKVFQIERTQEIYVVIDCSRLSGRAGGSQAKAKSCVSETILDRFLTAALLLALSAEEQGDHFGLVIFSDKVHAIVRANKGKGHFGICQNALHNIQPRLVTPDFDELFSAIRLRLRKRALIIFLTALDDPLVAESFVRGIDLVSRQHLILVNSISSGHAESIFSEKSPPGTTPEIYEALTGHFLWQRLRQIKEILSVKGVKFSMLSNELLAREMVAQYLQVKQRQML